jgi:hypothetical protein
MTAHHIATLLTPAWGQTTSYIHVATQMLNKDPDVVITIVQHNVMGVYVVRKFTTGLFFLRDFLLSSADEDRASLGGAHI